MADKSGDSEILKKYSKEEGAGSAPAESGWYQEDRERCEGEADASIKSHVDMLRTTSGKPAKVT